MNKQIHNNYPGIPVVLYSTLSFAYMLMNNKNEVAPE